MSLDHRNDIFDFPEPIVYTSGHRGRAAERFVNAGKIVIHKVERDRSGVVLDLF